MRSLTVRSARLFQSTLPVGGATTRRERLSRQRDISIHAPRGGSDVGRCDDNPLRSRFQSTLPVGGATPMRRPPTSGFCDFNPRSPWGERPLTWIGIIRGCTFQSTLPVGGATMFSVPGLIDHNYFNPRSPWGERPGSGDGRCVHLDFNPRSPWGERRYGFNFLITDFPFQSTLPMGGATFQVYET